MNFFLMKAMRIIRNNCKGKKIGDTRVIAKFALLPMTNADEIRWLERVKVFQIVEKSPFDENLKVWSNLYFL